MAKTGFSGYWGATQDSLIDPTTFVAMQDGIQADLENRFLMQSHAGVYSGLDGSISTTSIAVASGEGYGDGKRYLGGESITFVGAAAGIYYVYWDSSAGALAKSLTAPDTTHDILICSVVTNGSANLSALVDLRPWGLEPLKIVQDVWQLGTPTAGIIGGFTVPLTSAGIWIDGVAMFLSDNGSSGATIVDVNVANSGSTPATIWAAPNRRPSVDNAVANYTVKYSGVPDTSRKVTAGQNVTIEVDSVATGAQTLCVTIYGRMIAH